MSPAQFLTEWQKRTRLSDRAAAEWCELSVSAWRRQRKGKVIHCRQTLKLASLHHLVDVAWLDVAEAAMKAARSLTKASSIGRNLATD